jgi:hypothetical protein
LAAVMDFVLHHQAQPFPLRDFRVVGRLAFVLQIFVAEFRKNLHGFRVQPFHERHHVFVAVGQLFAMRCVAAGVALCGLRPHEAFCHCDVPQQIAQREFSRCVAPVQFVRRNAARHAHGAFAHISEILQERLNGSDFHENLVEADKVSMKLNA